jgi:hypothetical protein
MFIDFDDKIKIDEITKAILLKRMALLFIRS